MRLVRDLLDVMLTTPCEACGALAGDGDSVRLCASCEEQLPGHPWPVAAEIPGIASAWYLATYEGVGGELIRRGKYGAKEALLVELARLTARRCVDRLTEVDEITWVPSPMGRRMRRGFSLPEIFAVELAAALARPQRRLLARTGGARQATVERGERWANVRGVMQLHRAPSPGASVLLVDDVLTTGATASACAQELLMGGAGRVHFLAFASALT
jgi:predicted amidophosphoribosyltransferase